MNKDEERQKKFHEALLRILYPPPESPPPREDEEEEEEEEEEEKLIGIDPQDNSSQSSSDKEVENMGAQKLTRAQRKKIRRKKLKESALQRRKIIGPLLSSDYETGSSNIDIANQQPISNGSNSADDAAAEPKLSKLKRRRKAKVASEGRLSKEDEVSVPDKEKEDEISS